MTVDPDHRYVHFQHRRDIGRVVAADVQPAFLAADPARALFEVDRVRLVAAHLLGGDDEVEFGSQVTARDPQQFVVDVGDDPDLVLLPQPVHRRVGLPERQPVGDAVGQELSSRGLDFPADLAGDLDDRPPQHLGVELVGTGHDFGLYFHEALEERPLVEAEAVLGRLFPAGLDDAFLPVDKGAVAVGGHPFDVFEAGEGHGGGALCHSVVCAAAPPAPPLFMDLLEYQGKQLFAKHGIPVPSGEVAGTVDQAVAAAERIGYPCAIKAQVLIGGRGKAGGIKIAKDTEEARAHADAILGMDITGPHGEGPFRVDQVWIEGGSDIASEYYASVILDRGEKKLLAMVSAKGGMDIEAVAAEDPEALVRRHIDPTKPFEVGAAREIVDAAGLDEDVRDQAAEVLVKLAEVAGSEDANLIEVNPLIVTNDREVVALDAKVTIDGNALFRHQDLAEIADTAEDPQEAMAKEKGLTYVKLEGNVGILANGAGLCMSTLDVVAQAGGAPANFLDAGGGSKAEAIVDALTVITSDEKVTAILFNIFGGITRCDEIAKGIVTASKQLDLKLPLVVRLDGTNSEEGLKILAEANLPDLNQETTMLDAARRVVELAGSNG